MPRKVKRDYDNNPFETGPNAERLRELAQWSIEAFFEDKSYFIGGPIPNNELLSDDSILLLLRATSTDKLFNFIHEECLEKLRQPLHWSHSKMVPWTIDTLIGLLKDMHRNFIPKDFEPGLLLLYFKFCKGLKIPSAASFIKKKEAATIAA